MKMPLTTTLILLLLGEAAGFSLLAQVPPVKPAPVRPAADPAPAPVPTVDPVGHWMRYLMALLGALTAAIPVLIQSFRNGMATAAAKAASEENRVALGRLHGALADKLGLPPVPQEAPVAPTAQPDKLDQIIALLREHK